MPDMQLDLNFKILIFKSKFRRLDFPKIARGILKLKIMYLYDSPKETTWLCEKIEPSGFLSGCNYRKLIRWFFMTSSWTALSLKTMLFFLDLFADIFYTVHIGVLVALVWDPCKGLWGRGWRVFERERQRRTAER